MNRITTIVFAGLVLAGAIAAEPANAQNARSFVSGHGIDTAACTLAAPCRTLAHALTQTNAGGEIDVLDAAGYGSLTINKAISIVNDGVGTAGVIVPSGGVGITINAGANDAVSLRGLSVEGGGAGSEGIEFDGGASLTIENCVIRHNTQFGLVFAPSNSTSHLSVSNSLVADNALGGIVVGPLGAGTISSVFNRVELSNNGNNGLFVSGENGTGSVKVTVSESVASNNNGAGYSGFTTVSQAFVTIMLFHSVANGNFTGLSADGPGVIVRADNSMVTGSTNGWLASNSGVVQSYGNNSIDGNAGNETAPPSATLK